MASRFAQLFQRTGARHLLRQFWEPITYWPKSDQWGVDPCEDDAVEMYAKVERQGVAAIAEMYGMPTDSFIVTILNHETDGRLVEDIDDTGDAIDVAPEVGLEPIRKQIVKIISSESGLVRFLVR